MAQADMQRLQQEALRRVRDMQARAQAAAHPDSGRASGQSTPPVSSPGGMRNGSTGSGGYGSHVGMGQSGAHTGGHSGDFQSRFSSASSHSSGESSSGREYVYRNGSGQGNNSENTHANSRDSSYSSGGPHRETGGKPSAESEKTPDASSGEISDLFQSLFKDSDRTIILILLLLVMEEKGDSSLLLALMYLLL